MVKSVWKFGPLKKQYVFLTLIMFLIAGTDRSNLMEMGKSGEEGDNYPQTIANSKFWEGVKSLTDPSADGTDIAIGFASAGYYCCKYT